MKISLFVVFAGIFSSQLAMAKVANELPATQLLEVAREIVPQAGPGYFVVGRLNCSIVAQEFTSPKASCTVILDHKTSGFVPDADLQAAILSLEPMRGGVSVLAGVLSVSSITQEVPPYEVTNSASIQR